MSVNICVYKHMLTCVHMQKELNSTPKPDAQQASRFLMYYTYILQNKNYQN